MCALTTREEIVDNWLPRYTGVPLGQFGEYILLTNFQKYVDLFAKVHKVKVAGRDKPMPTATAGKITIINFGMGSANAATVMERAYGVGLGTILLSARSAIRARP